MIEIELFRLITLVKIDWLFGWIETFQLGQLVQIQPIFHKGSIGMSHAILPWGQMDHMGQIQQNSAKFSQILPN